jgi:DNA polymerase-3 subunit delta'
MPSGGRDLFHAYIISGPAGSGKHALADRMAAAYVCTGTGQKPCMACSGCRKAAAGIHPDIIRAGGEGEIVNAAAARALRSDAYIRPNEAPSKVYVIDRAQEMNLSAQNALLKVLEDGPPYAAFLLLTENAAALLPTIRSRCETIRLTPRQEEDDESAPEREEAKALLDLLTGGDELALAAFAVTLEKRERTALAALLDQTQERLCRELAEGGGDARILLAFSDHLKKVRRACDFNAGAGHLAGWLASGAAELQSEK